jgi:hypothetical protein
MECILGSGVPWLRPPSSSLVRGIKSSACRDKGDRREIWRTCGLEVCKRRALRVGNYEEGRMRRGCRLGSVAATEQERKVHAMRGRGRGRQRQGNHTSTTRSGHTHNAGVLLSYQLVSWYGWCCEFCHGWDSIRMLMLLSPSHAPWTKVFIIRN